MTTTEHRSVRHRAVPDAASPRGRLLGAIYDPDTVQALRYHRWAICTATPWAAPNPSLVEGAGGRQPGDAHGNKYNTWVAGDAGLYFTTPADAEADRSIVGEPELAGQLGPPRQRYETEFTWDHVAGQYEALLRKAKGK